MDGSGEVNKRGCAGCRAPCSLSSESKDSRALRGWRLTVSSALLFLAPVVLGIVGAACLAGSHAGQFVGAAVGVAAGMAGSAILARAIWREQGKRA